MHTPKKTRIVFICLHNEYSDSAQYISTTIKDLSSKGYPIDLYIGNNNNDGYLDNLSVNYFSFPYKRHKNKLFHGINWLISQFVLFIKLLRYRNENIIIYINNLLPIGAALAGKALSKPLVYNLNELDPKNALLKKLVEPIAAKTANKIIYSSNYLKENLTLKGVPSTVIYPSIGTTFTEKVNAYFQQQALKPKSARKSTSFEVISFHNHINTTALQKHFNIASSLTQLHFNICINIDQQIIKALETSLGEHLPNNVSLRSTLNTKLHLLYQNADLLLHLPNPNDSISISPKLFEAMHYGLPVVCSTQGAVTEIVEDWTTGYYVDPESVDKIVAKLNFLSGQRCIIKRLSNETFIKIKQFKNDILLQDLETTLNDITTIQPRDKALSMV